MNRRSRMPRALVAVTAVACMTVAGFVGGPSDTDAAWTDSEWATSDAMTAGRVMPVSNLDCTLGLLGAINFTWTAPAPGGLTRNAYRWAVVGSVNGTDTLPATATSMTLNGGLLGIGSGVYSLYAVGPGGWESLAATANVSFLTGLISSCTEQTRSP